MAEGWRAPIASNTDAWAVFGDGGDLGDGGDDGGSSSDGDGDEVFIFMVET